MALVDQFGRAVTLPKKVVVSSGVDMRSGTIGWDEPEELAFGRQRHKTLRKMEQSDSYIAEVLRANTLPLLSKAIWSCKPGKQRKAPLVPGAQTLIKGYDRAEDAACLVKANLMGIDTEEYGREFWMESSWRQFLNEILKMLTHGFSIFHKEDMVVGGKRVYRRLLWLEPESINRWILGPDDRLKGIERSYTRPDGTGAGLEFLPASELMLFIWDVTGTRLEGVPLLRSMYGPWKRKEFLLRCKMIAFQRAGVGIPWVTRDSTQDGDDTSATTAAIDKFLQQSLGKGIERGYLNLPNPSAELGYLQQAAADLAKFDRASADENLSLAHAGGTKAGMLGEMPGGSRAVGEVQQALAYVLTEGIGLMIQDFLNRGVMNIPGAVQQLHDWNYPTDVWCPRISVSGVDPGEQQRQLTQLTELVGAQVVKVRPQIEQHVLEMVLPGLDLPDEVFDEQPTPDPMNPLGPGDPGGPSSPQFEEDPVGEDHSEIRAGIASKLTRLLAPVPQQVSAKGKKTGPWRQPTAFEKSCLDLASTTLGLKQAETLMGGTFRRIWRMMIDDVLARAKSGKLTRSSMNGFLRSKPRKEKAMRAMVASQFRSSADVGKSHVVADLERQRSVAREIRDGKMSVFDLKLALPPKNLIGKWKVATLLSELEEESSVTGVLSVDSLWQRMITETSRFVMTNGRLDETLSGLEAYIGDLSQTIIDAEASEVSHVAYAEGRDFGAKEAATTGEAEYAIRSEVLDTETCEVCEKLDYTVTGAEYEVGSDEYEEFMPPSHCEGGDRCRGIYIVITKDIAELLEEAV